LSVVNKEQFGFEMSETLRQALEDIRHKLNDGVYQNEEHVRLSLVARVVQVLGWDMNQ